MRRFLLAICLTSVAACSEDPVTSPRTAVGEVVFTANTPEIHITNNTSKPVFTMIVGKNMAPLLDWFPCVDTVQCPPILPKRIVVKQYSESYIEPGETEALVYWWHAVMKDGTLRYDEVRSGTLRLR